MRRRIHSIADENKEAEILFREDSLCPCSRDMQAPNLVFARNLEDIEWRNAGFKRQRRRRVTVQVVNPGEIFRRFRKILLLSCLCCTHRGQRKQSDASQMSKQCV